MPQLTISKPSESGEISQPSFLLFSSHKFIAPPFDKETMIFPLARPFEEEN